MDDLKIKMLRAIGLTKEAALVTEGLCPSCGDLQGEFRDPLSRKEYGISGLCQKCQDGVFGGK